MKEFELLLGGIGILSSLGTLGCLPNLAEQLVNCCAVHLVEA